jgi:hypothetical protein
MKNIKIVAFTLISFMVSAQSALAENCIDLGGVAIANFFAEGEGKPITIAASLTGSVSNATGKINAQRTTKTGLEMDMEHYFSRPDGGTISTEDVAVLTAVPGKPGRFMIEITYDILEGESRGTLNGYSGRFNSYGLVDLRSEVDMKGLVRYEGKICK